jgi:hypothetical protein
MRGPQPAAQQLQTREPSRPEPQAQPQQQQPAQTSIDKNQKQRKPLNTNNTQSL